MFLKVSFVLYVNSQQLSRGTLKPAVGHQHRPSSNTARTPTAESCLGKKVSIELVSIGIELVNVSIELLNIGI